MEVRVGISSCLLGEEVRWDGGHKLDRLAAGLARLVTLVPVCPEVEVGMGVPREPIRLERRGARLRLVAPASGTDHTERMRRFAEARARELERLDLSGYVFKEGSASCGVERVRVWRGGAARRAGRGLFASVLMQRMPLLPVAEEVDLHDPALRSSFLERVLAYRRLKDLFAGRWRVADLVVFHEAEQEALRARDPAACARLGRLVARAKALPRGEVARRYSSAYLAALAKPAALTRRF